MQMYPMLERISPRTRKLELFARMHNTHAGYGILIYFSYFKIIHIYYHLSEFANRACFEDK